MRASRHDSTLTLYHRFCIDEHIAIANGDVKPLLPPLYLFYRPTGSPRHRDGSDHKKGSKQNACSLEVIELGFEPKTHSLEGCCSIQLSYSTDLS